MTRRIDTPPDLADPDAGLVMFGFWRVGSGREADVADAIANTWGGRDRELPSFGLVSYSLFLGAGAVLHYNQFARIDTRPDIDAGRAYTAEIDNLVPGIETLDATATRPYRSIARRPDAPSPGCYALVTITLEGSCPDGQRQWVDAVLDPARNTVPPPESGLIAAHFFLTTDRTRVLALTEWTTAEAQRRTAADHDPELTEVPQAPKATITADRYRYAFSLLPDR